MIDFENQTDDSFLQFTQRKKTDSISVYEATLMKTVNDSPLVSRPSALCKVATDWFIGGCLQWCLMYSRNFSLDHQCPRFSVNPRSLEQVASRLFWYEKYRDL
jgi:hypothetical protein